MDSVPSKSSSWEFATETEMLDFLVGNHYGPISNDKFHQIRQDRQRIAEHILYKLKPRPSDIGLEIGAGAGFISSVICTKVKHLYGFDISRSFHEFAQKNHKQFKNLSFHVASNANLSFIADRELDFAFSHAVFIHFNVYDIYWYFSELQRVIKDNGKFYMDFLDGQNGDFITSGPFREHAQHYKTNPASISHLLNVNSLKMVVSIANYFGFSPLSICMGQGSYTEIVFQKINGSFVKSLQLKFAFFRAHLKSMIRKKLLKAF